jgi:hypothetical protein
MPKYNTKIGAYSVELEVDHTQDPPSQCDVTLETTEGRFYGSLAMLQQEGVLYNAADHHTSVPQQTVDKIAAWAERNGY